MGRAPCCEKVGLKKGPWTPEEDQKLVSYINENGHGSWRALPKKAGLLRCGKSCRLRWTNYLRPDIKRGEFCLSEEQTIVQLHALLGNRWSAIASHLPKRTDNEIKNYWNTHLKKKLLKMGLDPNTHKPKVDNPMISSNTNINTRSLLLGASNTINVSSTTNHMAQWESARLEAEARLSRESHMRAKGLWPAGSTGGPSPLVSPTMLSSSTSWGSKPFNNNGLASSGALKAMSAVELMNALNNWEKSLQGQAGLMWPDSWRFPHVNFATTEVQADSSSCSSPSSTDANTTTTTTTTTTATPTAIAPPHHMDRSSPTSTLCSLDFQKAKHQGPNSSLISCDQIRKLSWSDHLAPSISKSLLISKVAVSGFSLQGVSCKLEGEQGVSCKLEGDTNMPSSLMQDVVFAASAIASPPSSPLEEGGSIKNNSSEEGEKDEISCYIEKVCERAIACVGGPKNAAADKGVCSKKEVDEDSSSKLQEMDDNSPSLLASSTVSSSSGGSLLGELDLEENKDAASDNDKSMCVGDEMISSEMFRDLPKLKSEAPSPHVSYSALLNEEIPDYWSNIMLKEAVNSPTLQQVDIAQGITF